MLEDTPKHKKGLRTFIFSIGTTNPALAEHYQSRTFLTIENRGDYVLYIAVVGTRRETSGIVQKLNETVSKSGMKLLNYKKYNSKDEAEAQIKVLKKKARQVSEEFPAIKILKG